MFVVKMRVEMYPDQEPTAADVLRLVRALSGLVDVVSFHLIDSQVDAAVTGFEVGDDDDVEAPRTTTTTGEGGPPYRVRPDDGRRYIPGPGGWYPVPTLKELDEAEQEFGTTDQSTTGATPLSLVGKEEKRDGK